MIVVSISCYYQIMQQMSFGKVCQVCNLQALVLPRLGAVKHMSDIIPAIFIGLYIHLIKHSCTFHLASVQLHLETGSDGVILFARLVSFVFL